MALVSIKKRDADTSGEGGDSGNDNVTFHFRKALEGRKDLYGMCLIASSNPAILELIARGDDMEILTGKVVDCNWPQ